MLRSLKYLEGYRVQATDGQLGAVVNFLLDDEEWTVRYVVVDTGGLLASHEVVISPRALRSIDWSTRALRLDLTVEKVRNSPSISTAEPVTRQHEHDYLAYYGFGDYWGSWANLGPHGAPAHLAHPGDEFARATPGDGHLRSAADPRGYHIEGTDGSIGHVADFIVDDETWRLRYLVIDTSNWWLGKHVLVAPHWATSVDWLHQSVHVGLTRRAVRESPRFDPEAAINREYEARLYDYYGRPVYWASQDQPTVRRST